jgi:hypothetical protein
MKEYWKPSDRVTLQREIWIGRREEMNEYCIRIYWDQARAENRTKPWFCEFAIFPVHAYELPGDRRLFYATEDQEMTQTTEDIDAAWPETDGSVKWDGCTEVYFKQQHFCGAGDLAKFCEVLTKAREAALEAVREESDGWVS